MNQKSFSPVDNTNRETEEILQKMETITKAKKNKKNNYKNVDVLENVYEETEKAEPQKAEPKKAEPKKADEKPDSKTFVGRFTDFAKGLTEMQENMEKINKELEALDVEGFEGFAEEGFEEGAEGEEEEGFEEEGFEEGAEGEEDEGFEEGAEGEEDEGFEEGAEGEEDEGFEEEGFTSYGPKKLYRREYEPTNGGLDGPDKTLNKRLMRFARRGKLSKSFLRRLLKQGLISRRQYNRMMRVNRRAQQKRNRSSTKSTGGKCKSNRFKEFLDKLVNFIRKYTDKYNNLMREMAIYIYEFAGGSKTTSFAKNDINVVAKQLKYFFMVPFALYFTYNWYYILFYRDESNQKIPNTFGETTNDYASYGVLRYLFTSLVQPMIVLNAYFRRFWPWIIESGVNLLSYLRIGKLDFTFLYTFFSNPIVQFLALAFTILYYACKYGDELYNAFFKFLGTTGSIKMPEGQIYRYILLILVFDIIVGVVRHSSTIVNLFNRAMSIYQMMTAPIITFVLWLILVIFTFMNMQFAILFCILYLYVHSYFALGIYGTKGAGNAWNDINQLLRRSVSKIGGRECPPNPSWIEKVFVILMSQLFNLLIIIMFIIVLFYGIYSYVYFMKAESPKGMLVAFNMFIVLSLVGIVINSVRSGILNFDKGKQYDNIN